MRGGGETGGERASVLGEGSLCQEGREDGLHPESSVQHQCGLEGRLAACCLHRINDPEAFRPATRSV